MDADGKESAVPPGTIYVIDDETNIRRSLTGLLEDEGYRVEDFPSAEEGSERIDAAPPDLLLLDVRLPGVDGIAFLQTLREGDASFPVVVLSGHATIDSAVRATRLGAFDFIEKPLDPERLLITVRNALEIRGLQEENRDLRSRALGPGEMIGDHPTMAALREEIGLAAPSRSRVLIYGENGTGKELVARAIHAESPRRDRPFIKVNCAAIPKDLIESELFGHEKGSFTGATEQRIGKIEAADGGTLLLDEVGDMSLETQAKLLRVLEARELERVGGRRAIPFDVRVVSATNKNLRGEIEAKRFREDLFFRLAVIPITVPPLRERAEDIPVLVDRFIRHFAEENGRRPLRFSTGAMDSLLGYRWPGNVRELKNLVERLLIMGGGPEITAEEVERVLHPASAPGGDDDSSTLRERVELFEMRILTEALRRNEGNVAETARELRTDRANLHRKMKRYGIRAKEA
ncbi:MAG: sigma-54-dependent Fis family transcriptional regulator [Candidatus Eisenbacteria bacterium]|nr:sigma-54-dependent Fis family transcriptional regulator [Candidatus Eisenbacteria bacterium]